MRRGGHGPEAQLASWTTRGEVGGLWLVDDSPLQLVLREGWLLPRTPSEVLPKDARIATLAWRPGPDGRTALVVAGANLLLGGRRLVPDRPEILAEGDTLVVDHHDVGEPAGSVVGGLLVGLPEAPEWLGMYADHADPVVHRVTWGRHYNGVGAPQRALALLEPAYRERPHAAGLELELAFAYNALERFDEAIAVLKGALARRPEDALLGGELGFAYLHAGKLELAVEQYLRSIPLCDERQPVVKSEMAMNLSLAYERLGDTANVQKWRAKAKAWAPPGSAVFRYFNP